MTVRFGALIVSALVLGALTAPSFAYDTKRKVKHHAPAPVAQRTDWKGLSEDFFSGGIPDPGSDNRYFSDTRKPDEKLLGAPIFERQQF